MTIQFKVAGQELRRVDNAAVAANSVGFLEAEFTVPAEWSGLTLKAVFIRGEDAYAVLLDGSNRCAVAPEALAGEGNFSVGLVGIGGGGSIIRATTSNATVRVLAAPPADAQNSVEPTAGELEQIEARLAEMGVRLSIAATQTEAEELCRLDDVAYWFAWFGSNATFGGAALKFGGVYSITKSSGSYSVSCAGSLKGEQGERGAQGEKGDPGEPLKVVISSNTLSNWVNSLSAISYCLARQDFNYSFQKTSSGQTYSGTMYCGDIYSFSPGTGRFTYHFNLVGEKGEPGNDAPWVWPVSSDLDEAVESLYEDEEYSLGFFYLIWAGNDNTSYTYREGTPEQHTVTLHTGDLYNVSVSTSDAQVTGMTKIGSLRGPQGTRGVSVVSLTINNQGHLIAGYSDNTTSDAGAMPLDDCVKKNAFYDAMIHRTAGGAVAEFTDGADNVPLKSLVAQIVATQSGSGDPSAVNVRPISGRTGMTVTRYGTDQSDSPTTVNISFPISMPTVYGGYLDVVSGILTVTHALIPSYAGEQLPGAWISDRDVYSSGATPTTGAQVVYELATPQLFQLAARVIRTLYGTNHVCVSTGDCAVTYRADATLAFNSLQSAG